MRTNGGLHLIEHLVWRGLWVLSPLMGAAILALYAWLPVDGVAGSVHSFSSEGFLVQSVLEDRAGGLREGDLIVRAGGYTTDEWLQGVPRGPAWRTGGVVNYEVLRDGQRLTLPIRLAPVSFQSILGRWTPQLIVALCFFATGTFVFWKRPHELPARLLMLICVTTALQHVGDGYGFQYAALPWRWPFWLHLVNEFATFSLTYSSVCYLALTFPTTNSLVKRFPHLVPVVLYTAFPMTRTAAAMTSPSWGVALVRAGVTGTVVSICLIAIAATALIRSIRVARDPVTRAQLRWIVWVGGLAFSIALVGQLLPLILTGESLIPPAITTILSVVIPFVFGVAILRYRLWDIDVIINRTLVYGSLTIVLSLGYWGIVTVLQQAFRALTGQQSPVAVAVSTLLIAILFRPLRHRIQTFIDRRFYREKVDFRQAFLVFSQEVRTIIDLPDLLQVLVQRVTELLHVEYGAVFLLAEDGTSRQARVHDLLPKTSATLSLDRATLSRLRGGETISQPRHPTFPFLVPLLALRMERQSLMGVLALGPRLAGQDYARDDRTLLQGLADQAGTAIHVAQLIEEKQAEINRKEAAEAASQTKDTFLTTISHELRTPLSAIIGYSELLQEEAQDLGQATLIADLEKIRVAGRHLLTLVSAILDFSEIEAGKVNLHLETFELVPLLEDVVTISQPLAQANDNTLQVHYPETLGVMHADLTKVRQILLNLLSNAAKFTQQGHISLMVTYEPADDTPIWVCFHVVDTGIGMTAAQMTGLFQPFMQVPGARQPGGTGLGLAISQRFCQLMGGEIEMASRPGEGTSFTVRLPRVVPAR